MLLQFSQTTASGVQGRRAQEVAWAPRRTPVSTTLSHSPCGSATCLKILSKSWSCIGPVHKRVLTTSSKIRSFEDPGCFFKNAMMISRTRSSKASCPTTVAAGNTRARGDLQRFSTRSRLLTLSAVLCLIDFCFASINTAVSDESEMNPHSAIMS